MPRWWVLSQTPANNGRISRNVRTISSPHSRPWRGAKRFLRLVSLSRSRKTDALEKHTPNQRLSICVPTPQVHVFFGSTLLVLSMYFRSERKFKDVFFQHHNSCTRFPQMKARDPDCRSVTRVSVRSLWPPSMWLSYPTNLCHRIIVFKGSAHWQMMCDQFCNNATCLPWEMKSWHFIQLEVEWTCCVELKVTLILINV